MRKHGYFVILISFAFFLAPATSQALMMQYTGIGTGYDYAGVTRQISGEMIISDAISDPLTGYPILNYQFSAEGLFDIQGTNGGIGELAIQQGGLIFPPNNEFYVSGNYQNLFYHSEGPAVFLHDDLTPYSNMDYLNYDLPAYVRLDVQFYVPGQVALTNFTATQFILKGSAYPPVPEPATIILLCGGLAGLTALRYKQHRKHCAGLKSS